MPPNRKPQSRLPEAPWPAVCALWFTSHSSWACDCLMKDHVSILILLNWIECSLKKALWFIIETVNPLPCQRSLCDRLVPSPPATLARNLPICHPICHKTLLFLAPSFLFGAHCLSPGLSSQGPPTCSLDQKSHLLFAHWDKDLATSLLEQIFPSSATGHGEQYGAWATEMLASLPFLKQRIGSVMSPDVPSTSSSVYVRQYPVKHYFLNALWHRTEWEVLP